MIRNLSKGTLLAENECYALGFFERLRGMLGRKFDGKLDGMVFPRCSSIHMFFMGMELDAVFLDRENRVVKALTAKPWGVYFGGKEAVCVLELPEGSCRRADCREGDVLDLSAETVRPVRKGEIRSFAFPEAGGGGGGAPFPAEGRENARQTQKRDTT